MTSLRIVSLLAGLGVAAAAAAQSSALAQAIESGQAGERFDGYMGVSAGASAEVRRQVAAVNIRRRNLYIELAGRRHVSVELVGNATACELLAQVAVGQSYQLQDGIWRRRNPGQPAPVPAYCR